MEGETEPLTGRASGKSGLIVINLTLLATVVCLSVALVCQRQSPANPQRVQSEGGDESFYDLYSQQLAVAKYIDLTHPFEPSTPLWEGFSPPTVAAGLVGVDSEGFCTAGQEWSYGEHGFVTTGYYLSTDQLGTQLDPPAHWEEMGATISDLPPTFSVRPLVVVDVHSQTEQDPGYHATVEDVQEWEARHGDVPEGAVVMFRSDWSLGWDDYAVSGMPGQFPGVSLAALEYLHNTRHILMHGHEPLDTDMTPSLEGEAWLMHNHYAQAEGVANLHLVPEAGCLISIGFAKPQGGTGGYARYIAICPPSSPHGVSIAQAPGAPLPPQSAPLRRGADGVMRPSPGATPTVYCSGEGSLGCPPPPGVHYAQGSRI